MGCPAHARDGCGHPSEPAPYASFIKDLIARYGPRGTFWSANRTIPRVPIRMWQVWNEPNISEFWAQQPFARSYVALLRAGHAATKSADPRAKVILAGLPNYSGDAVSTIYKVRGGRWLFDVLAVRPYTKLPQGVITILTRVRNVMTRYHDARKPLAADEVSWPSSKEKTFHNLGRVSATQAGQAQKVSVLLPLLANDRAELGLTGFYCFTWAGIETRNGPAFDFAGLLGFSSGEFVPKPALAAFRGAALTLESCREKGFVATACVLPG